MPDDVPTLIRFLAPKGDRVRATQAGYVVGLLDVAGYSVRGLMPDDAIDFDKAATILSISKRFGLIARERDGAPPHAGEVYVLCGSSNSRASESRIVALGDGSPDNPIVHEGDPIATGRAILRAARVGDAVVIQ